MNSSMPRTDRDLQVLRCAKIGMHTADAKAVARLVGSGRLLLLPCHCRELCLGRIRVTPLGDKMLSDWQAPGLGRRLYRAVEGCITAGVDAAGILCGKQVGG